MTKVFDSSLRCPEITDKRLIDFAGNLNTLNELERFSLKLEYLLNFFLFNLLSGDGITDKGLIELSQNIKYLEKLSNLSLDFP